MIKFDNYYAIACSENFFVGLYSSNLNLLKNIPLDDISAEDTTNIGLSEIKYKCTITKTKNNIIVGVIDDDKPTHGYKIFSFNLSGTTLSYNKYIFTPAAVSNIFSKALIKCMGLGNSESKILCILIQNNGILTFDIDMTKTQNDQPGTVQLGTKEYREGRVSQCDENTYIVSAAVYDDGVEIEISLFEY